MREKAMNIFNLIEEPNAWRKGYFDRPYVKRVSEVINHYNDGLLTMKEMLDHIYDQYHTAYEAGSEDPHFSVPAIPLAAKWYAEEQTKHKTLCIVHRTHADKWHAYTGWWAI